MEVPEPVVGTVATEMVVVEPAPKVRPVTSVVVTEHANVSRHVTISTVVMMVVEEPAEPARMEPSAKVPLISTQVNATSTVILTSELRLESFKPIIWLSAPAVSTLLVLMPILLPTNCILVPILDFSLLMCPLESTELTPLPQHVPDTKLILRPTL